MIKTCILKCDKCGSILVLPNNNWFEYKMVCTICQHPLRKLDEDFDLAEIIEENNSNE